MIYGALKWRFNGLVNVNDFIGISDNEVIENAIRNKTDE